MQQWYIERRRAVDEVFAKAEAKLDDAKTFLSPSGRYSLQVIPYSTGPKSWGYSKGIVRSTDSGEQLAEINRNYSAFPHSWSEGHPTGHDYLIAGEDYQGQTIVELDTQNRFDGVPDAAEQGFGFCWTAHYPTPDGRFLFVDGCVWAAPYELVLYDFGDPMCLPYKELGRWPVWDVEGFQADGSFVWRFDVEVRTSDGKRVDEMSDEEQEAFEADEEYDKLLGERSIRMKWHPNGHIEELPTTDKKP
ncbi:MAG: hypothetical protein AAFX06_08975 [Planctomycetota bacterium]